MMIADRVEKAPFKRPERGKPPPFQTDRIRSKGRAKQRLKFALKAFSLLSIVVAAVIGAALLYRAVSATEYFTVKGVHVSGTRRLDPAHLERMAAPLLMGNIFTRDLEKTARMLERDPWVESISVRIKLPDIAEVAVVERTPAALAGIDGKIFMVDASGMVIAPADGTFAGVVINGLEGAEKPGERIADPRFYDAFQLMGVFKLDTSFHDKPSVVMAGSAERMTVATESGLLLKFGPEKDEWEERFMEYLAVRSIESDFGPGFTGYDLSFKNQLVAIVGAGGRPQKTVNNHRG